MIWMFLALFAAPALAAGGAHHSYSGDDDGDGIPNWRDSHQHDVENTETYVVGSLTARAVNLAIFLGIVGYAARRPVGDFLRGRSLASASR